MANQCTYITTRGTQCKKKTRVALCHLHKDAVQCPICLDITLVRTFPCKHVMCKGCLSKMRNIICPICRQPLDAILTDAEKNTIIAKRDKDIEEFNFSGVELSSDEDSSSSTSSSFDEEYYYPNIITADVEADALEIAACIISSLQL